MNSPEQIYVYCDGASRGNPGPASLGVVAFATQADVKLVDFLSGSQAPLFTGSEQLGVRTNNEAEYEAIIFALKKAIEFRASSPVIHSDSELVIKQMRGEYKVKDTKMKALYAEAIKLALQLRPKFLHVPREKNQIADHLANLALDDAARSGNREQ